MDPVVSAARAASSGATPPTRTSPATAAGLDLADAVAVTGYDSASGPVRLTAFVSAPDGVLVVSATGPGSLADAGPPRLCTPHPGHRRDRRRRRRPVSGLDRPGPGARAAQLRRRGTRRSPTPSDEPAADGTVPAGMGFAVAAAVRHTADETRLIVAAATGFRGPDQRPSADLAAIAGGALARVARALAVPTPALRDGTSRTTARYFDRADLDAARRRARRAAVPPRPVPADRRRPGPGTQPAQPAGHLERRRAPRLEQQLDHEHQRQMNYWAAESTGLPDLHEPLLTLTRDLAVAGEPTAAAVLRRPRRRRAPQHRPVALHRAGARRPAVGELAVGAAVAVRPRLGPPGPRRDVTLARDVALPVLRAAAQFTLDMLVPDRRGPWWSARQPRRSTISCRGRRAHRGVLGLRPGPGARPRGPHPAGRAHRRPGLTARPPPRSPRCAPSRSAPTAPCWSGTTTARPANPATGTCRTSTACTPAPASPRPAPRPTSPPPAPRSGPGSPTAPGTPAGAAPGSCASPPASATPPSPTVDHRPARRAVLGVAAHPAPRRGPPQRLDLPDRRQSRRRRRHHRAPRAEPRGAVSLLPAPPRSWPTGHIRASAAAAATAPTSPGPPAG